MNKDKCIPVPGKYAPFPLIFACVFLTILAYISRLKASSTLIVSTIIGFISIIETIGILTLIIHAYKLGLKSTFGLSLAGLLFLYGINLFFSLIYNTQILND